MIKPEIGKWYELKNGYVGKARIRGDIDKLNDSQYPLLICGNWYSVDGKAWSGGHDIIREVQIVPALNFELKAGQKYCTVKPDGSAGPVVGIRRSGLSGGAGALAPWDVDDLPFPGECAYGAYANHAGEIYGDVALLARITAPHVEPPPSPIERLEKQVATIESYCTWPDHIASLKDIAAAMRSIIADLKREAKA